MKVFAKKNIILILILSLALFLRVVDIENNPPALYGDELTLAYDTYSILKTGHDQTGAFLPLTFTLSEGRPPGYVYLSIPFISMFGPNALGVRFLSVLSGLGITILIYFLSRCFFSKRTALLASFFAAISPWDLSLSRGGFETHLALFLALLGIYTLLKVQERPWLFIVSAFSFGLSMNTYHSYKLVVPIIIVTFIWFVGWKKFLKREYLKYVVSSLALFVTLLLIWLGPVIQGSNVRFNNTNIFNQEDTTQQIIQKINSERTTSPLPASLSNLFSNRISEYAFILGNNYLNNFSTDFLFLHGDGNPRHNQGLMGEVYLVQAVLILFGVIFLFQSNIRLLGLLFIWSLIAPLPTALVSSAHALRSSFLLPPLIILSAYGASKLLAFWKESIFYKTLFVGLSLGLLIQFSFLVNRVYFLYPYQFGSFWSLSAKQASALVVEKQPFYDRIILSDRIDNIHFAYPVYTMLDPFLTISQYGKNIKQFGNVYIETVPPEDIEKFIQKAEGKILYIGPADINSGEEQPPLRILDKAI